LTGVADCALSTLDISGTFRVFVYGTGYGVGLSCFTFVIP